MVKREDNNPTRPAYWSVVNAIPEADPGADRAPIAAAVEDTLSAVRRFLAARCRDADLADELAQETAARLAARPARLEAGEGYAVRIAHNVWRDWLRRELVRRRAAALLAAHAPTTAPAADAELLARELDDALGRAIAGLPRPQRDVVELRRRGDLTFAQIAARLRRPLGTVLSQMRAALARLNQMLEAYR